MRMKPGWVKWMIGAAAALSVTSAYAVNFGFSGQNSTFNWVGNSPPVYSGGQGFPSLPPNSFMPPQGPGNQGAFFHGGYVSGFGGGHSGGFGGGHGGGGSGHGGHGGGGSVPDGGNPLILLGSAISGLALLLKRS